MIIGIGTDIVSIPRMAENIERRGDAFAERVLAGCEMAEYSETHNKASFLAKRFAVKEAAAKALGTGFADGVTWRHIYTDHDKAGKPLLVLTDAALQLAQTRGISHYHVSISDEKEHAVAFVVMEG